MDIEALVDAIEEAQAALNNAYEAIYDYEEDWRTYEKDEPTPNTDRIKIEINNALNFVQKAEETLYD